MITNYHCWIPFCSGHSPGLWMWVRSRVWEIHKLWFKVNHGPRHRDMFIYIYIYAYVWMTAESARHYHRSIDKIARILPNHLSTGSSYWTSDDLVKTKHPSAVSLMFFAMGWSIKWLKRARTVERTQSSNKSTNAARGSMLGFWPSAVAMSENMASTRRWTISASPIVKKLRWHRMAQVSTNGSCKFQS